MDRILLEVDDKTAKAWRNTSGKLRKLIEEKVERFISESLENSRKANFELLLEDARREAAKNGLTEEILEKLLNEED
jgi:hypothetical protein